MATACAKIWWTLLGVATVQWFSAESYKPYTKPTVCSFFCLEDSWMQAL